MAKTDKEQMDELFDSVHFDKDIEFQAEAEEENDDEDTDDTFEEVMNLFFPWSKE